MTEIIQSITEIETTRPSSHYEDQEDSYGGHRIITNEQEINLLMANEQSCCEVWGYFFCNDDLDEFVGAELHSITLTDTARNTETFWERAPGAYDYRDNIEIRREFGTNPSEKLMFVNLETDRGTLQFVAYNAHNGYYGHAARVESKQLTHEESL